jgi:alkanesulfonate monooxygenase SsuD/methylene tetrahydromethanopterin reductase-like flavin-dependent oxidoreductase (luciferase family)
VARYLNLYREQAREYGYEASSSQLGWASPVYVADTDERAQKEARAGMESLFNDFLAVPFQMLLPPGYTSLPSMKNTMRLRKQLGAQKRHSLEELMESGTVVVGSPKTVRDELSRLRDKTGAGNLVTMLQVGVLPDDLTRRNMELFASDVMPHLK